MAWLNPCTSCLCSPPGAEILAMGLGSNNGLVELNLARNSIKALGAKKLAKALEANTSLK